MESVNPSSWACCMPFPPMTSSVRVLFATPYAFRSNLPHHTHHKPLRVPINKPIIVEWKEKDGRATRPIQGNDRSAWETRARPLYTTTDAPGCCMTTSDSKFTATNRKYVATRRQTYVLSTPNFPKFPLCVTICLCQRVTFQAPSSQVLKLKA
jgi:hypothetical protein